MYGSALLRPLDALAVQADLSVRHLRYRLYDEAFYGTDFTLPYTFVNPRVGVTLFPDAARARLCERGATPRASRA